MVVVVVVVFVVVVVVVVAVVVVVVVVVVVEVVAIVVVVIVVVVVVVVVFVVVVILVVFFVVVVVAAAVVVIVVVVVVEDLGSRLTAQPLVTVAANGCELLAVASAAGRLLLAALPAKTPAPSPMQPCTGNFLFCLRLARAEGSARGPPDCLRSGLLCLRFGLDPVYSGPDFCVSDFRQPRVQSNHLGRPIVGQFRNRAGVRISSTSRI